MNKHLVHGIANCTVCKWECQDFNTVQRRAADHARRTGHWVTADLGYVVEYGVRTEAHAPKETR